MSAPAALPVLGDAPQEEAAGPLLPVYRRAPVQFVRGQGVELFDGNGRAYLDFTSGIAVNSLGYADEGVAAIIRRALESGLIHVSNLYHSEPAHALAEALIERSFASSVFFCNSGAEANEGAFKFARRWARMNGADGKTGIVALRGSFHGRLFATLAATDRASYRAPFMPLVQGISIAERDVPSLAALLGAESVAAVIVEPVQGEGGVRVLEPAFLRALRELTRERRIALIFDEVQCGLGRTGYTFAYEASGVEPDIMTLAKPIAGGLPMGAILMTAEIASAMRAGDHGSTFGGGPLVSAVALHVVERLSDPSLLAHVRANGAWMADRLGELVASTSCVRAVRGVGHIWGVDVMAPASQIVARALELGLLICSAGEHTVRLLPPLVATRDDLNRGIGILEEVLH